MGDVGEHLSWLRLRGLAAGTIEARRRALVRLAAGLRMPLLKATDLDLAEWRASLHLSPKTICCYVSHAHQFYSWAVTEGLIESNPATRLPVPRKRLMLPRPIAEDQLLAALVAAAPRIRPWLVLAGWAGLRA